jgi:hypothetical protein
VNPAVGPFAIAAAMLVIAGALKSLEPVDTAGALRLMGLPSSATAVRVGGVAEVAIGAAALAAGGPIAALLVAMSYGAFATFVVVALARRLPVASCGCLGRADVPPSRVHVGVNVAACVAAVGMVVDASVGPLDVVRQQSVGAASAFVALVIAGVVLSFAVLTRAPGAPLAAR